MIFDWKFKINNSTYIECSQQVMSDVLRWDVISEMLMKQNPSYQPPHIYARAHDCPRITVEVITWRMPEKELKNLGCFIGGFQNQSYFEGTKETVIVKSTNRIRDATRWRCNIQICAN